MKHPWLKFYPSDWRAEPALRICSIGARGLWIDMLCLMHDAQPCGSLVVGGNQVSVEQLAAMTGTPVKLTRSLFAELEKNGVFSRDEDNTIYSRRMRRDLAKAGRDEDIGDLGGSPLLRRGSVPKQDRVRPYKKSDAPEKTARVFASTGGRCRWCDIDLTQAHKSASNYFQIDHLLPVCDGGSNDEANLTAACAVCSQDRKEVGWPANSRRKVDPTKIKGFDPTPTMVGVGCLSDPNTDTNAQNPHSQKPEAEDVWVGLRQRVTEAFVRSGNPYVPDTSWVGTWKSRDYDPQICLSVVESGLQRNQAIRALKYFDQPIADAHVAPKARARASPPPRRQKPSHISVIQDDYPDGAADHDIDGDEHARGAA